MAVAPADAVALGDAVFGVIAQGDLSGAERVKRVRAAVKASVDAVEAVRDGSGVPADGGDVGDGDAADEGLLGLLRWRAGDAAEHPAAPGGTILHASVASGVVGLVELIAGLLPSLADERDASGESPMALLRSGPLATSERARNALDATQRLRRARIAQNVPGGGAGDGGEGGDIAGALPPVSEEPGEAAALVAAVAGGDGGELGRDVGVRLHNFALARLESGRVLSAQRLLRAADAAMLRAAPGAFLPDERAAPLGRLARVRRSLGDAVGADAADGEALRRWGDAQRAPAKPPKAAEVAPAALHVGVVKTVAATATATSAGAKATADPTAALTDVMALAHAHAAAVELEWEEDGGDGSPWRDWSFEPVADVEGEGDGDSSADGGAGRVPSLPYLPRIDRSRTLNAAAPARTAHVGEGQLRELIHELGGAPFSSRWPGNAVGGLLRVLGRRWNVLRRRRDGRGYMSRRWHRAPGAPPAWVAFRTGYFLPDGRRLLAVLHDSGAAPPTPEAPAQWRVEGFWARGCDALIAPHEDAPAALPWPDAAAAFEGGDEERAAAEAAEAAADALLERIRRLQAADTHLLCDAFDDWRGDGAPAKLPSPALLDKAARAAPAAAEADGAWRAGAGGKGGGAATPKSRAKGVLKGVRSHLLVAAEAALRDRGVETGPLTAKDVKAVFDGSEGAAAEQRVFHEIRDAVVAAAKAAKLDGEHTVAVFFPEWKVPKLRPGDGGSAGAGGAGGGSPADATPRDAEEEPKRRRLALLPLSLTVPVKLPAGSAPSAGELLEVAVTCALQVELVDDEPYLLPTTVFSLERAYAHVVAATPHSRLPAWLRDPVAGEPEAQDA
eukprot:CAMPEP_0203815520 /NCGR_PEP_ID=MMETSP0115-20131106/11155_1 /ASSEMBLY_ACC=CAM_ASM_000227 /TAXON_ID=33651 /ORGANISM="Bicosoecid sp, Strain ms1" /LENGTH=843 /DNA_ID=CAMNT_0050724417 /DNA_START=170 /DNA_END=2701 /DNA_ORIENTATION=+